jgi:hypothetical protein
MNATTQLLKILDVIRVLGNREEERGQNLFQVLLLTLISLGILRIVKDREHTSEVKNNSIDLDSYHPQ